MAVLAWLCCAEVESVSQESVGIRSESIVAAEKRMQKYIDDGMFAGISTAVVKGGKLVQRADFGFADIENGRPIQRDTLFRIFSMTKPIGPSNRSELLPTTCPNR